MGLFQEITDNGLGSYNNVVNVTKKNFDAYYETWEITRRKCVVGWEKGAP